LDAGADAFKNPPPCSEVERPKSNLTLATKIQEEPHSLKELQKVIEKESLTSIALPRLATGAGGLK